ncbi:hypothetical protein QEZ54_20870 [Catellatospora sp. KI3]|uniref:hypothetical protein n=1 Tax=Catellatospora sp. KI3 TaxID=3041620 RepID=UPI0024832C87|nr:hypothetical protein [Catellatospora sp. KI3]MDI1463438.1 hypothetical protein [Catellatospora sp. KI3]
MRKLRSVAASAAVALALTGCLPEPGAEGPGNHPTGSGAASASPTAAPSTELKIDKSYWYAGFKGTLGAATVVASSFGDGRTVTIEGVFQNLSTEYPGTPTSEVLLTVGDRTYTEVDRQLQRLPEIPAQRSQPVLYAFTVDEHFVLADAVLVVGKPSLRQAVIPFAGPDGLVSLEPRAVPITGKVLAGKSGGVFMTVTSAEVRADEPYLHGQAPSGQEFLQLKFSATNNTAAGFAWVFDRDLHLKAPDGTSLATADNCSRAQIYPAPHATATGGLACFLVPAPAAGTYLLSWNRYDKGALRVAVD